jgi:hypothetical protein
MEVRTIFDIYPSPAVKSGNRSDSELDKPRIYP